MSTKRSNCGYVSLLLAILALGHNRLIHTASAADWPTYRGDNARSGATSESVTFPLKQAWKYESPAPPELAWSSGEGRVIEGKELGHRVKFDDVFHPVVVGNRLFFGSTSDDQLHCLDLQTGRTAWTFFTGGPIRLAPTVADGRVYFGSDDGRVYCVDALSGEPVWQFRAGPVDDWLLARGEMISRWPVRTGVLVDQGTAYFGAGIFPHEDVFLYALDATDGSVLWKQDNLSAEDAGRNDLSPQGYLLANDELLFVPSGRSLPAAFDRQTGELVHKRTHSWRTTAGGVVGGTKALLCDGQIYSGGPHHLLAMSQEKGDVGFGWFAGRQMAVLQGNAFVATGTVVAGLDRLRYAENSRVRHDLEMEIYTLSRQLRNADKEKQADIRQKIAAANEKLKEIADIGVTWQQESSDEAAILAAENAVFIGGQDVVTAYDRQTGEKLWQHPVDGNARGLAVANGALVASTDRGVVHVFAASASSQADAFDPFVFETSSLYQEAAKEILDRTKVRRGFCLVVDGQDGQLAYELARQSDLEVYMVESDADRAAKTRRRLAAAGVYGSRVTVHDFDAANLPYSNYFANLIVSDRYVETGESPTKPEQIIRHLKPAGGMLCLGQPSSVDTDVTQAVATVAKVTDSGALSLEEARRDAIDGWATLSRGQLPGAGSWSHQYGNAANTATSDDQRVKGGLGVLWYGDPGIDEMVNRHDGAVGPIAIGGRLFVQDETTIRAYDAYNGLFLWKADNPRAIRLGVFQNVSPGNLAATAERLFHFIGAQCYELDAATGETLRVHELPPSRANGDHQWGYIAVHNNQLFGTATLMASVEAAARRRGRRIKDATDAVFSIDLQTGEHLWTYEGQSISHRTIAIGPNRVFFIDSSITSEQRAAILQQDKTALKELEGEARKIAEDRLKKADLRRAVALDARTGKELWGTAVDVTDCSEIGIGGGMLTLMYQDGTLILCGANANGHYWPQFVAGDFSRRRLVALSAEDGYKLWAKDANYRSRPIIIGQQILAEPWMYDLKTGSQVTRKHPITGEDAPWSMMRTGHHCGMLTAADSGMVMFRSGYTGFMDLEQDAGVRHFAGHRLGCWINAVPANGLVMIPEASAGCVCLFSIASTIVLEPREARRPWAIYSSVGAQTPVQDLAINLGAPGDRKDDAGVIWLSYPRYRAYRETSLDIKMDLQPKFANGGEFESVSEFEATVADAENPWLLTSWAEGLEQLTLPILGEGDAPADFSVDLHFAELRDGQQDATFDVLFNGKVVLEGVRPTLNGSKRTIDNVTIEKDLVIEFRAAQGTPILNAVRVRRQGS